MIHRLTQEERAELYSRYLHARAIDEAETPNFDTWLQNLSAEGLVRVRIAHRGLATQWEVDKLREAGADIEIVEHVVP